MALTLRHGTIADAHACGQINYEIFKAIADKHGFAPDFPSPEIATRLPLDVASPSGHPRGGRRAGRKIVGGTFFYERSPIVGVTRRETQSPRQTTQPPQPNGRNHSSRSAGYLALR
jgi:hypothetical protein